MPRDKRMSGLASVGSGELRQQPTVIVAPTSRFGDAAHVAAFKQYHRVAEADNDSNIARILLSAETEAERCMWRAIYRQTRERVWTQVPTSYSGGAFGWDYAPVPTQYIEGFEGGFVGGLGTVDSYEAALDSTAVPVPIGEPFESITLDYLNWNDTVWRALTVYNSLPDQGMVWGSWTGGSQAYRARYVCGWATPPPDVVQAVYEIAAGLWEPRAGGNMRMDAAKERLILTHGIRERRSRVAVGSLI